MYSKATHAVFGAMLTQAMACGFPRPADVEPDSGPTPPICGDSKLDPGEDCDDGNTIDDGNGCDSQCHKNAICGDSKIQAQFEICDGAADCSLDCKEVSVLLFPVSDKDGRYNGTTGTWDMNFEDGMIGDVIWEPRPEVGGPLEWRTALEFDTHALRRMDLLKVARLIIFPTSTSQQLRTLQLHGYSGDGVVAVQDMSINEPIASFLIGPSPIFFDINTFVEAAASQQYPFMGFLLRLATAGSMDPFGGVIVALSDNSDPNIRPRLEVTYCVDSNHDARCD